ncbi:MAG: DUF1343 domain-containing protein [Bdellovibrionales bacterium]|nr:DUF1343 domain-containing protein [Bdellovibrionales bacterium]
MVRLGLENLLANAKYKKYLKSKRVAVVGNPASVTKDLVHTMDALSKGGIQLSCAFGPQHGLRGEKQDNMIESEDFLDPKYKIPIFSLYGEVRRPTSKMLEHFDIILFDLQDVGCRIYTFLTTLFYVMEDCARIGKEVWVLDRPNPAGRPVEGSYLDPHFFSFVGGAEIVMRHGLTLGEAALWYKSHKNLDIQLKVLPMTRYEIKKSPGYGWDARELSWVNPSPNMPNISTARMYAGTVLIEGSKISEGRGTTRPLELFGAPGFDGEKIVRAMTKMIPQHLKNVGLRTCFFEPTFQKHTKKLCSGFQIHIDQKNYKHDSFKPYRIVASAFKAVRQLYPDYDMWLSPPYEYEKIKMPIDILSGSSFLREWVDDSSAKWGDLERHLVKDEKRWLLERKPFLIYK